MAATFPTARRPPRVRAGRVLGPAGNLRQISPARRARSTRDYGSITHAITIDAPSEAVWSWIVPAGLGTGGVVLLQPYRHRRRAERRSHRSRAVSKKMNEKQEEVPSIMEELIGDSDTDGYDRNYWQIRSLQYWMSQLS